eukprot:scaffold4229_cov182-Chaetoceros_neogracile.AAC.2
MDLQINLDLGVEVITTQASLKQVNGYGSNPSGGTMVPNPSTISMYGNAWNSYRLSSSYTFDSFSKIRFALAMTVPVVGICFTETLTMTMSDVDIDCFQFPSERLSSTWGPDLPRAYRYNIALGKKTLCSSFMSGGDSSNAVDGRTGTFYTSELESNPWYQVNLGQSCLIRQIFLYKNPSAGLDGLSKLVVTIIDNDNAIQFQNSTQSSDQVVKMIVPKNVYGSGVRISIDGDSKVLSIGEIELYDAQDDPVRKIDIPSGQFFDKKKVNYITLIQEHGDAGVSQLYNLTFVSGSSEVEDSLL